jgi:hypothetical protein
MRTIALGLLLSIGAIASVPTAQAAPRFDSNVVAPTTSATYVAMRKHYSRKTSGRVASPKRRQQLRGSAQPERQDQGTQTQAQ